MFKRILIILEIMILPSSYLFLQEIPDCWCMPEYYPPNGVHFNSHFVFDTCGIKYFSADCDSAYWLNIHKTEYSRNRIYAKHTWLIWFDVKAIPLPYFDPDTTIEVSWRDVDSINYPEIKNSLESIENEYGHYKMVKLNPEFVEPYIGQTFFITFDDYVNGVELEIRFRSIPYTSCDFKRGTSNIDDIKDTPININKDFYFFPNPTTGKITIKSAEDKPQHLIELYSPTGILLGKYQITLPNTKLDLSQYPAGIYFLQIGDEFRKVVVMK